MSEQESPLASKISEFVSGFPEVWQEYQDWLGDIMASHSVLRERYPAWQAALIIRWRLVYFAVYTVGVILFRQLLKRLKRLQCFLLARNVFRFRSLAQGDATINQSTLLEQSRYILQRTATLLAVVELTLCAIAAFTGILLAFYYQPTALGANESLMTINREIANGTLVLSLHNITGNSLIAFALVQIVVMFVGREFSPSWFISWISGLMLMLTAIGLGWTAIVLNWDQIGFWRFNIELNVMASIPLLGPILRRILLGGSNINSITMQHMYALHSYILAFSAMLLSITHLTALVFLERNGKSEHVRLNLAKLSNQSAPNRDSSSS